MAAVAAALSPAAATVRSKTTPDKGKRRAVGDFGHFGCAVRRDVEFLKKGVSKGLEWAHKAFRIPEVSKAVDDVVWLRNLEDPNASPEPPRSWPRPSYPGTTFFFWGF